MQFLFNLNWIASKLLHICIYGYMTIFRLNGHLECRQFNRAQLLKGPHLISTRYSFHPTEQVPVYGGRGSGCECRQYKYFTATLGVTVWQKRKSCIVWL